MRNFRDRLSRLTGKYCAALLSRACIETLESRQLLSTSVLTYHNDITRDGVNSTETTLSPANVKVGSFGKLYAVTLDGNAYAQPLVVAGEPITAGVNTIAGAGGTYNVVYEETENDSIYAIDSGSGAILWQRSFLTGNGTTPGTDISNTLGATAITAPTSADVNSTDITPIYGITGTPVIDPVRNIMYVVPFTKEIVNGVATFVQRIHAINLSDGTDAVVPQLMGTTTGVNTNTTNIYVYGTGDGAITDPYNNTGKQVVQFNAESCNQRQALSLVNGTLYIDYASHGDNYPYHGWIISYNVSNLTTSGFVLSGVFCSSPNGGGAGIWGGAGGLAFDPDNSSVFYFETGNGFGQGSGISLDANGFPVGGAYFEAVVKMTADPTTSPANQNVSGWGFKVLDYFIPYNQGPLDNADLDLGSGSPIALPDSAGIPGHPHLLIAAGKQGVVYVIDRDNMGKYSSVGDNVINAVPNGTGNLEPPVNINGLLSTPVYYNGTLYMVSGYYNNARAFTISSTGALVPTSITSTVPTFGFLPGAPTISSNGTQNGIVWITDRANNELHAFDANSLSTELWNSNQAAGSVDAIGAVTKFVPPTVANGEVFVGTLNQLVIYGLKPPVNAVPLAPSLSSTALSSTSVKLSWTDPTTAPNTTTSYSVEELINNTWTPITTAPGTTAELSIGGLNPLTSYSFRMRGLNGAGYSNYSNVSVVTTTNTVSSINFASGFNGAAGTLALNGSALINGSAIQLTAGQGQVGSFFSSSPVAIAKFSTSFEFQLTAGSSTADGLTFTIQGASPTALGAGGGGLGFQGLASSVGIKFDLYNNSGEGTDSTGIYTNGAVPTVPAVDMTSSGVNLHSGDIMSATLTYDGTTLSEQLLDTVTGKVFATQYAVNIASVTGANAYVGMTAAAGLNTTQNILNWAFSPNSVLAPTAPTALGATVASATSVSLNWTNNATNQTGFLLDRATDPGFTQNLLTQTLPATPATFTDSAVGLNSGGTYYYRIRAFNTAGSSVNSNVASVTIPYAPVKPTNCVFQSVTTNSISISWTDNAGQTALGYQILRAVNGGVFSLYATLPALSSNVPTEYDWTDTGLNPGTNYNYHIRAYNIAGYNDFVGGNAATLTAAPLSPTTSVTAGAITLAWTAPVGATAYNIYRGTASGAESSTPIASGVTANTYVDNSVIQGNTYYYYVTALNGNLAPLNGESAASTEVSASASSAIVIQAENYDTGGQGVGYSSSTTVNQGGAYRNDGVGIEVTTDTGGGYDVGWTTAGEWLKYTFNVPVAGSYTLNPRIASPNAGGVFHLEIDGVNVSGPLTIPNTGGWQNWVTLTTVPVAFSAGTHVLKVFFDTAPSTSSNLVNLNYVSLIPVAGSAKLYGTPIGTQPSFLNNGDTIAQVFDGNLSTAFDAPNNSLTNWVGLDLGAPETISQIRYAPRAGYEYRMYGGQFQASSTADFSSNVVTLATISAIPVAGQFTSVSVNPGGAYRYVRYVGGTQWVNIAEMEVDGILSNPIPPVTASAIPLVNADFESPVLASSGYTYDATMPGWTLTGNAALAATGSAWGVTAPSGKQVIALQGLPSATPGSISQTFNVAVASNYAVSFLAAQRSGYGVQPVAVLFDGVRIGLISPTSTSFATYTTVSFPLSAGSHTITFAATDSTADKTTFIDLVAINPAAASAPVKLNGTVIGTSGSWLGSGDTIAQVFDGNLTTYYDSANNNLTNWAGLDLGAAELITQIKYAPRAGYEYRMVGGQFQVSSTPDFSSNVVTLYTISTAPVAGQLTTIAVNPGGAYRYVRYVGGTQWVNIAEMEVDGIYTAAPPVSAKLSGTAIGTSTSFMNSGDTIAQVFDGNLSTYFDAPNSSLTNWVGLDLGTARTITQIKYAPRAGYEYRMVGGQFQVSTTADFSSNVTTIYTVTAIPTAGQLTSVAVSLPSAYRYVRFVGGTQWVNIAEMEVDGY